MRDYTIILDQGTVRRNSDGKIIAPCQSAEDPDFLAYIAWAENGNEPEVLDTEPSVEIPVESIPDEA